MIILNDIGIKAKFKLLTWIFTYVRVKIHVFRLIKTTNIVMFLQFPVAMNIINKYIFNNLYVIQL